MSSSGGHAARAYGVGPIGQGTHERLLFGLGRHGDGDLFDLGQVEVDVVVGDHVGELFDAGHEFGQVREPGEALLDLEAGALGFELDGGHDLAERARPCGERRGALRVERPGSQIAAHVVQFAHRIGHRRAGGEHDVGAVPLFAQQVALVEHVLAFRGRRHLHAQIGRGDGHPKVLEMVGLVDEEHVDSQALELQSPQRGVVTVLLAGAQTVQGRLDAFSRPFEAFDGGASVSLHRGGVPDRVHVLPDAFLKRAFTACAADMQLAEPALGHDDRVPVAGGHAPPETSGGLGAGCVVIVHDQDACRRIQAHVVGRPLARQMVGHHDHGFARPPQPFGFVHKRAALERFACADHMRDECALVGAQGAGDGVLLVGAQFDAVGDVRCADV